MHISLNQSNTAPVAWIPNSLILNVEKTKNVYSYRISRALFTVPLQKIPNDGKVEIDLRLITDKKLTGSVCTTIKNACKDALKTQIEVGVNRKNDFRVINLFNEIEKEGKVLKVEINTRAIPVLIEHQLNGYTKVSFEKILSLSSMYETKWLEIISRLKYKKRITLDVPSIRIYLGTEKLKQWDHFKEKAIKAPFAGINKKLGSQICFVPKKKGRSIYAIEVFDKTEKSTSKQMAEPINGEHDLSCRCFDLLPITEQKKYINNTSWFNVKEFQREDGIASFKKKNSELLKKFKNPTDVINALNLT